MRVRTSSGCTAAARASNSNPGSAHPGSSAHSSVPASALSSSTTTGPTAVRPVSRTASACSRNCGSVMRMRAPASPMTCSPCSAV